MELSIKTGIKGKLEKTVTPDTTASSFGSGLIEVFATPAMVALMENTAWQSVNEFLPDGHCTVGSAVNIKHVKATPLGEKVWCESVLTEIKGKKLTFQVRAWDQYGEIGTGVHTRYIIEVARFMENLNKH